jgi:hypothetical protein
VSGTLDPASGAMTATLPLRVQYFGGNTGDEPCPSCATADGTPNLGESGVCSGGPRSGLACVVGGLADAAYGAAAGTSVDCPPFPAADLGTFDLTLPLTSGAVTLATSPASPNCRAPGFRDQKCLCDTCNNVTAALGTPCSSNTDCPASGGQPGVCGGRRCLGGTNVGVPCAGPSDCPGGFCGIPGAPTSPNQCDDGVCTASGDGGICAAGPSDTYCARQPFRPCTSGVDCPAPGDSCSILRTRSCIPDGSILSGDADPASPVLVGAACAVPSTSAATNSVAGLAGPVTFTLPAEVQFRIAP